MVAKNDVTGDAIVSKPNSKAFEEGWERIFGKGRETERPTCAVGGLIRPGAMCALVIVGGKLCGSKEPCPHQQAAQNPPAIKGTLHEVVETEREFVYLGSPVTDDPHHDCDAMGCGRSHVLARVKKQEDDCPRCTGSGLIEDAAAALHLAGNGFMPCPDCAAQKQEGGR